MNPIPHDRYQRVVYGVFLLLFAASFIRPPYREFLLMQHAPTAVAAVALGIVANRYAISRASFTSIVLFLCLHTLGARYLYSYVPYDAWSERWLGFNISQSLGTTRNHYDRLVHFSYGLLLAVPIQEFERRHLRLSALASAILAVECILATSAAYELTEWFVAIIFSPTWADQFLGQQGDIFDAQKDMALATVGAMIAVCAATILRSK